MKLKKVLDAGRVVRYHATLIDKKQDNAQHQYGVSIILAHIFPETTSELLLYALTHDTSEIMTGDIPAPVKRMNEDIKALLDKMELKHRLEELELPNPSFTNREYLAVKWADVLEGIYYTTNRTLCGDIHARPIRDKWIEYAGSLPYLNDTANEALEELKCL